MSLSIINSQKDAVQQLEIFVACRSLKNMDTFSKSDPQVILYVPQNTEIKNDEIQWIEAQRTEQIDDNLNPNFVKTFKLDYYFEKRQVIKIEVVNVNNFTSYDIIGSVTITVGNLVAAQNQTLITNLENEKQEQTGKLILKSEPYKQSLEYLKAQLKGIDIKDTRFFGKTCPFLRFYNVQENNIQQLIHQTEVIHNDLNPCYQEIEVNLHRLCNSDYFAPIQVELWDHVDPLMCGTCTTGEHKFLGSFVFTISQIINKTTPFYLILDKQQKQVGKITFVEGEVLIKPTFINFIQGGTQLAMINAIDFTQSNGEITNFDSLHNIQGTKLNPYQQALKSVGEILLEYDFDKKVPMYGYGGKPNFQNLKLDKTSHCFPMNGNVNDQEVFGLKGILDCYKYAVQNVVLSGPTLFSPLIKETMKLAQATKQNYENNLNDDQYYVLLILTDGIIHDMQETKNCIVESAYLPLSIIIIGVGDADFSDMDVLDGDEGLWNQQGQKAQRDLVQFVPYDQFKYNTDVLAAQVLEELPQQLEEYMQLVNRQPNNFEALQKPLLLKQKSTQNQGQAQDLDSLNNVDFNYNHRQRNDYQKINSQLSPVHTNTNLSHAKQQFPNQIQNQQQQIPVQVNQQQFQQTELSQQQQNNIPQMYQLYSTSNNSNNNNINSNSNNYNQHNNEPNQFISNQSNFNSNNTNAQQRFDSINNNNQQNMQSNFITDDGVTRQPIQSNEQPLPIQQSGMQYIN